MGKGPRYGNAPCHQATSAGVTYGSYQTNTDLAIKRSETMLETVKRIFLDPSRCIGCRSCVAACRECDSHKGESMVYIDYVERHNTVASSPTLCMHCEDPMAP